MNIINVIQKSKKLDQENIPRITAILSNGSVMYMNEAGDFIRTNHPSYDMQMILARKNPGLVFRLMNPHEDAIIYATIMMGDKS